MGSSSTAVSVLNFPSQQQAGTVFRRSFTNAAYPQPQGRSPSLWAAGDHQVRTADPLLYEARKTHQPVRWQLPRIQAPTAAGKGIWDCTNGTRNSLATGIFCPGIFKHLNLFQWAALVEEERGDKSDFQEQTPAEMGQRAFLHVGLLSLQCLSNSQ